MTGQAVCTEIAKTSMILDLASVYTHAVTCHAEFKDKMTIFALIHNLVMCW